MTEVTAGEQAQWDARQAELVEEGRLAAQEEEAEALAEAEALTEAEALAEAEASAEAEAVLAVAE